MDTDPPQEVRDVVARSVVTLMPPRTGRFFAVRPVGAYVHDGKNLCVLRCSGGDHPAGQPLHQMFGATGRRLYLLLPGGGATLIERLPPKTVIETDEHTW